MASAIEYFQLETNERLERFNSGLMAWENTPNDESIYADLFREAHSLKGAAGVTGLPDVVRIFHNVEELLTSGQQNQTLIDGSFVDTLLTASDQLSELIQATASSRESKFSPEEILSSLQELKAIVSGGGDLESASESVSSEKTDTEAPEPVANGTEDSLPDLDPIPENDAKKVSQAESQSASKPILTTATPKESSAPVDKPTEEKPEPPDPEKTKAGASAPIDEKPVDKKPEHLEPVKTKALTETPTNATQKSPETEERSAAATNRSKETVRLGVEMLESLGNATGELMVAGDRLNRRLDMIKHVHSMVRRERIRWSDNPDFQESIKPIALVVRALMDEFTNDVAATLPLVSHIHDQVLHTRMLPMNTLFDSFSRFLRDYCRKESKKVDLQIEGGDTCVDREVLEKLRDPIVHIVRNAVSHGIESIEDRKAVGKSETGRLTLTSEAWGDRIRVVCEDNGRGINPQRVLNKALSTGIITTEQAEGMSEADIYRLILQPGFSTASSITDISGRGVGMDVVAERLEELQGSLDIESELGKFTRFILEFPATAATIDGLLVEAKRFVYIFPTTCVSQTARVNVHDIQTTAGGEIIVHLEGRPVPVYRLMNLLGRNSEKENDDVENYLSVVVVKQYDRQAAIVVDRMVGTQTVIAKPLGPQFAHVRTAIGATILGDGMPALILDVSQLLSGISARGNRFQGPAMVVESRVDQRPILIVDDSMTTRIMEQTILESAGYDVQLAVSAEDALERIDQFDFRLFVVDVEMPGLNGFQLTERLRSHNKYAETPIIMVTSLCTDDHRRQGAEAGVNEYIVKGEFDQNNLLESVRGLIGS